MRNNIGREMAVQWKSGGNMNNGQKRKQFANTGTKLSTGGTMNSERASLSPLTYP